MADKALIAKGLRGLIITLRVNSHTIFILGCQVDSKISITVVKKINLYNLLGLT